MASFLRPDSPFYRAWSAAADLVVVNVLTLAACLPVVTAGAALTACARVTTEMAHDEDVYTVRTWWRSFRTNLVQSLAWWVPVLVLVGAGLWEWRLLGSGGTTAQTASGAMSGLLLAGAAVMAGVLVWLVPLVALFENSVAGHLANAVRLAVGRLDLTAACLVLVAAPVALVALVPAALVATAWFMVLIGLAFIGYLMALVQRGVVNRLRG